MSNADPNRGNRTAILPDRVELAYRGLVSGWAKERIKKALKEHYGIGWRAAEEIIFQARKRRSAELIDNPDSARDELVTFVDGVRQSDSEKTRDKLRAAELQMKRLGLVAPQQPIQIGRNQASFGYEPQQQEQAGPVLPPNRRQKRHVVTVQRADGS